MSYTLIALALLMGAVSWWLIKQTLNVTPWVADGDPSAVRTEGVRSSEGIGLPSVKLGLVVFLAVATSLFALFISAYTIRMQYPDWRPLLEPNLLWINSGYLLMSSVFLQVAWMASKHGELVRVRIALVGGTLFTLMFIAGQITAWIRLTSQGDGLTSNPANGFFFVLTAVHALHLLGGLVALGKSIQRVWRSPGDRESIRDGLELCAVYWHYLLAVWAILFWLLLQT